jgi:hypothetical protein
MRALRTSLVAAGTLGSVQQTAGQAAYALLEQAGRGARRYAR